MLKENRSRLPAIITTVISVALVSVCAWGIVNRQYVVDLWRSVQYQPPAQVEAIVKSVDFSDKGKFYFYASTPSVDEAAEFNNHCQQQEAGNAILGCYTSQTVYIYNVPNSQLNGIEEVTAAHETLHAIWERMSSEEQNRVGKLLEESYKTLNDEKLNERMDYYARTEPGERLNELHSILATEYTQIGPDLEAYYSGYFKDRAKVVALHNTYQAVFIELQKMTDNLSAQLQTLKVKIDQETVEYNAASADLRIDVEALKSKSENVDITSAKEVNQYNAERQSLITRSNALEQLRQTINSDTTDYNSIVENYNKIVTSINTLTKSLDSTLAPTPGL